MYRSEYLQVSTGVPHGSILKNRCYSFCPFNDLPLFLDMSLCIVNNPKIELFADDTNFLIKELI